VDWDDELHGRFEAWIDKNWRHGPCPVCQTNSWSPLARLGQISNLDFAGRMVPLVLIQCDNCGYLLSFNAIAAGIVPPDPSGEGSV
jgi:C4-type Zn-finger protein